MFAFDMVGQLTLTVLSLAIGERCSLGIKVLIMLHPAIFKRICMELVQNVQKVQNVHLVCTTKMLPGLITRFLYCNKMQAQNLWSLSWSLFGSYKFTYKIFFQQTNNPLSKLAVHFTPLNFLNLICYLYPYI